MHADGAVIVTFLFTPEAFLDPGGIILQASGGRGRLISGSLMIFRRLETAVDEVLLTWEFAQRLARSMVRQATTAGKKNTTKGPLSFSVQLITHMLKCFIICHNNVLFRLFSINNTQHDQRILQMSNHFFISYFHILTKAIAAFSHVF